MFGKKKRTIKIGNEVIELQSKPGISSMFTNLLKKPTLAKKSDTATSASNVSGVPEVSQQKEEPRASIYTPRKQITPQAARRRGPQTESSKFKLYIEGIGARHKGLENALKQQRMKESLYEFVKKMLIASAVVAIMLAFTLLLLFHAMGLPMATSILFALLLGVSIFYIAFEMFLRFPTKKSVNTGKNIERDILFAARDMIISLRSGMPLFNAITSISSGYGDASKEFAKIVEQVQLGTPLEDAIDQTVAKTKSPSFRRLMLQAAVSIKAGADVVSALQSVIDQLSRERVIELRRYGQRLNAIAMFYMLFGIILPSMGIAVVTILTTFIALFTVTTSVLEFALVVMFFLQVIFLQLIRGSRPVFTM